MRAGVEAYIHAGLPTEAAAVLLVEVAGPPHGVADDERRIVEIARTHRCRTVRVAQDEAERALLWKGRKTAFGAVARIKPNYYLHDTVVPSRPCRPCWSRSTRSPTATGSW
ncbi:MAG: FAD-linked oxidase C-terminal domain-containing protein [Ilumatobacteraceae bacterium]